MACCWPTSWLRSRAPVLVTDPASLALLEGAAAQDALLLVVFVDGVPEGAAPGQRRVAWSVVDDALPAAVEPREVSQLTVMIYTSGTTGRSKAVVLPHAMYTRGAAMLTAAFGYRPDDVFLHWTPLSHVGGQLHVTMTALVAGAALTLVEGFRRPSFWSDAQRLGATTVTGFASMLSLLLEAPPGPQDRAHGVRLALVGSASPELQEAFTARFGVAIKDSYGMSECEPLTLPDPAQPRGSCGRVGPDFEIAILDPDDDRPLPPGSVGRIAVRPRVPHVMMQGYEGDAAATVAAWQNLWFHTQDLGRLDGENFLFFVERMKDAIRRGGENIAAAEVERVLRLHPDVADCAVLGVADSVMGQEVMAVVVPLAGRRPAPAALRAHAAARMAAYMVPRYLAFAEALPYSDVGKVRREALVELVTIAWDARAETEAGERA